MTIHNQHCGKVCLVLGGRGFIGVHLVTRLLNEGCQVRILDRPGSHDNCMSIMPPMPERAEFIPGNFTNENDVERAIEDADYIFHLVSTTLPSQSNDDPIFDIETNLVSSVRLLDLVRKKAGVRLIFVSSGGTVYGIPEHIPISEQHPTKPICSYGICKLAIENYLGLYHHLYGLDYVVLRLSNPYGRYQNPLSEQGVIPVFMLKLLKGEPIRIWGDGSVARDFIHIDDVVNVFSRVMNGDHKSRIYNVGSGVAVSLMELINALSSVTQIDAELEYSAGRNMDVPVSCLDIRRASEELDWKPEVKMSDGLRSTWEWLCSLYH